MGEGLPRAASHIAFGDVNALLVAAFPLVEKQISRARAIACIRASCSWGCPRSMRGSLPTCMVWKCTCGTYGVPPRRGGGVFGLVNDGSGAVGPLIASGAKGITGSEDKLDGKVLTARSYCKVLRTIDWKSEESQYVMS